MVINEVGEAAGLTGVSLTSLLGVFAGVAVVVGAIALFDAFTVSAKEARKAWQESAQAYEESVQKISSLEEPSSDIR